MVQAGDSGVMQPAHPTGMIQHFLLKTSPKHRETEILKKKIMKVINVFLVDSSDSVFLQVAHRPSTLE